MDRVYRIALVDETGTLYPVMDADENLLDYDLAKPLARTEIIERIADGIRRADALRGRA